MGLLDYFKSKMGGNVSIIQTQTGNPATYTQFGNDVYASEIVLQCVRCITNEMKKLSARHIIETEDSLVVQAGDIADVLAKPNELMTFSDFMEKITFLLFEKNNVFIYPQFIETGTGRKYTGLYPLYPSQTTFGVSDSGRLVVEMKFNNGVTTVLPYSDLIHWRYNFSTDDFMGGADSGKPDNSALLDTLQLNKSMREGMKKAANAPVNGVVKYGSVISETKLEQEVQAFNKRLKNNESGILGIDAKSEYQQINNNIKVVDKDTMEYIKKEICGHYGVSLPILEGTATIDQKRAFYDSAIEPLIISLNQAFTDCIISNGRKYRNHKIVFYYGDLLFMTMDDKINFVKEVGSRGVLTDNQILGIFGMPPFEGGDVRRVSLNYVDVNIANNYQLANAGADEPEGVENNE